MSSELFLMSSFSSPKRNRTRALREISFTTETVHGVWYEFKGNIERGPGKNPGDEAYYLLKGTLTQYSTDSNKKTSSKSREVSFKSFPQDLDTPPPSPN